MRSRALHAIGITCGVKGTRRTTTNFADVTCERCRRLVTDRIHADVTAIREELASQRELIEGIERAKAFFAARKESMCFAVRRDGADIASVGRSLPTGAAQAMSDEQTCVWCGNPTSRWSGQCPAAPAHSVTWPSARRPVSFSTDIEELEPWGEVEGLFAALTAASYRVEVAKYDVGWRVSLDEDYEGFLFASTPQPSLVGALRAAHAWTQSQ